MFLHFLDDDKFAKGTIEQFESVYKGRNIYIINSVNQKSQHVEVGKNIICLRISKNKSFEILQKIIEKNHVIKIFAHNLTPLKALICSKLKLENHQLKLYWIFYGADLHSILEKYYGFNFQDYDLNKFKLRTKIIDFLKDNFFKIKYGLSPYLAFKNYVKELNFFCFWNKYDFSLLKDYFETDAKFLEFYYVNTLILNQIGIKNSQNNILLINNSASINGNHRTILNFLKKINAVNFFQKIIIPLSYGDEFVKNDITKMGYIYFGEKFYPMLEFLSLESYFEAINGVSVAIFGANRQEAGGNIFHLLGNGSKVYLRKKNNMLECLRDWGFIVFCFEEDLISTDDLLPLSLPEMKKNIELFKKYFNQDRVFLLMSEF